MPKLWQETLFLKHSHKEISKSKPLKKGDTVVEYVPSQIFTEYLLYMCRNRQNKPYDGIIYRSSLTNEKNVCLFYDNATSEKVLDSENIKI